MTRLLRLAALALAALPRVAQAETAAKPCHDLRFEGTPYTICTAQFGRDDLRLWARAPDGLPIGTFGRLADLLAKEGKHLGFAMNAGMYAPDLRPLGLTIIAGQTVAPIVTAAGPGNFGMRPNGVFCIGPDRYRIVESRAFAAAPPDCRYATQSGPMLVIDAKLHPRFVANSTSFYLRNGVGVSADGQSAVFAISDAPVSFYAFARLFRDGLGLPDALFLDGAISKLDAPGLRREDFGLPMGPILGTVVDGAD